MRFERDYENLGRKFEVENRCVRPIETSRSVGSVTRKLTSLSKMIVVGVGERELRGDCGLCLWEAR